MLIRVKDNLHISSSEITEESTFLKRRYLIKAIGIGGVAFALDAIAKDRAPYVAESPVRGPLRLERKLQSIKAGPF